MSQKFAVIRYALHDECVECCEAFDSEDDALTFMNNDAADLYTRELEDNGGESSEFVDISVYPRGARVSTDSDCFVWTWDVFPIGKGATVS